MFISVTLRKISSRELLLLKQLDIKYVDLSLNIFPHYQKDLPIFFQKFDFEKEKRNILKIIKVLNERGVLINSFNGPPIRDALFGKPCGEKQVNDFCNFIKILGEKQIPLVSIKLSVRGFGPAEIPGRYVKKQGREYKMGAFSLELMKKELEKRNMNSLWSHHFREKLTFKDFFSNCLKVLKEIIPFAEEHNVKLVWHPEDPPVEDNRLLPGFSTLEKINKLLNSVSSPNFGIIFCTGTLYESGLDIYKLIDLFGKKGKIFHVHFRNVKGNLLNATGYEEVALDDGDMNMLDILKSLKKIGYDGAINPDHVPIFINNEHIERHGTAYALDDPNALPGFLYSIGYIKALMSAVEL